MDTTGLEHKIHLPGGDLTRFVERFWMVANPTGVSHEVVVVPDGRIDFVFSLSGSGVYTADIIGIENEPSIHIVSSGTIIMGIGLKLLAVEYCLKYSIASLLGSMAPLLAPNPGITAQHLFNFDSFCHTAGKAFQKLLPAQVDSRKQILFDTLYETAGGLKVKEYSERCYWTSRQINRYFTDWFGLSLKEYCSILRFRACIDQIKEGKLFPEQNYSDQPHFIREVRKFSGVTPKELFRRQHDRFIQLIGRVDDIL